jgi:TonB family protein
MLKHFGSLILGVITAAPVAAQVPRIPQAPVPPATAAITQHCPDDTGCPFPGAIVPEHTNAAPVYPASLRQAGVSGAVRLRFVVNPDGMVAPGSVRVIAAAHPELGAAASQTVQTWEFHLLGSSRRASSVPVRLTVEYVLGGQCSGEGSAAWSEDRRNPRVVVTGCSSTSTATRPAGQ